MLMLRGYRSVIVNVLAAASAIVALPEVTGILPEGSEPLVIAAQGVIAVVMRFLTTTPIGRAA